MENINPYNVELFKNEFKQSKLFEQLANYADIIVWSTQDYTHGHLLEQTPRETRGTRIFSAVPFYFINMINNGSPIFDLGCGWNIYEKYYTNLTGLSGDSPAGHVNDAYVENHVAEFDNTMSMNALHFAPLSELHHILIGLVTMTKTGGRIFVMLNICQMLTDIGSPANIATYVREVVSILDEKILSFELDDAHISDNMSEGTFRLVMEKTYE